MLYKGNQYSLKQCDYLQKYPSDLIPELQGRFPIKVQLDSLTEDDFVKILTEPDNAVLKQYKALLGVDGVNLNFDEEAIKEIAKVFDVMESWYKYE